jgi:transposase-like protein
MTDTQRMTTQELVRRTLLDEHGDFLKEAVAIVAAQLMDAEVTAQIGAGHGEVSADRVTHRNGYRPRGWGDEGRRDRATDPQEALGVVLPVVSGAAAAL